MVHPADGDVDLSDDAALLAGDVSVPFNFGPVSDELTSDALCESLEASPPRLSGHGLILTQTQDSWV